MVEILLMYKMDIKKSNRSDLILFIWFCCLIRSLKFRVASHTSHAASTISVAAAGSSPIPRDLFSRQNYAELVSEGSFQFASPRMRSNLD